MRCSDCWRYRTTQCLHNPTATDFESVQPFACFVPKQYSSTDLPNSTPQESEWYFLKPNGRFSRMQFFKFYAFPTLGVNLIAGVVTKMNISSVYIILLLVLFIFLFYLRIIACIRRLHDLNQSGWYSLIIIIPLIDIVMGLILLFAPGKIEGNRWQ